MEAARAEVALDEESAKRDAAIADRLAQLQNQQPSSNSQASGKSGPRFIKVAIIANLCWNGSSHDNRGILLPPDWLIITNEERCHPAEIAIYLS